MKKFGALFACAILAIAGTVDAATITTDLWITVPSSIAFSVTLYGESPVTSGATTDLNCSSSTTTADMINTSVVGGAVQDESNPIAVLTNNGNVNEDFTLAANATWPTGAYVKVSNAFAGFEDTCVGTVAVGTCANLSTSPLAVASAVAPAGTKNIWIWCEYAGISGGTSTKRQMTWTSSAS